MTVEMREALPAIIADQRRQLAPAHENILVPAITATIALLGFTGSEQAKREWIAAAALRLQDCPADLVIEALANAERTCRTAAAVVSAVYEYVEDYPARRRARLAKLLVLADAIA